MVRIAPQFPDTYGSLGMIHQGIDDHDKAIQYYMMEAELSSEDVGKWRDIVQMALQYNQKQQAIYCLNNIVKLDPEDTEAFFLIVDLSIELEDYWRAIETLHILEEKNLEKHDIVQRLVPCYHAVGDSAKYESKIELFSRTPSPLNRTFYFVVCVCVWRYDSERSRALSSTSKKSGIGRKKSI